MIMTVQYHCHSDAYTVPISSVCNRLNRVNVKKSLFSFLFLNFDASCQFNIIRE